MYDVKMEYPNISSPAHWVSQQFMTAKECDKMFGTNFSNDGLPDFKDHPLYRMLKARK